MTQSADENGETLTESNGSIADLRSSAERLASGLKLLRWAMITWFATGLLNLAAPTLITALAASSEIGFAWGLFAFEVPGWAIAPLSLIGVLAILGVRQWSVPRWLAIVLVAYLASDCVWSPMRSVYVALRWLNIDASVIPSIDVVVTVVGVLLSLMYFAALFAGFHLADSVDKYLGRSLISELHLRWLLWLAVVLHGVKLAWWGFNRVWDLMTILRETGYSDLVAKLVIAGLYVLLVGLPHLAWFGWVFVLTIRIGRKLKRLLKLNRCPRCDYDLRNRLADGCPECGWWRGDQ